MFELMLMNKNFHDPNTWQPKVMTPWVTPATFYNGANGTATFLSVPRSPTNPTQVPCILITPGEGVAAPNANKFGRIVAQSGNWQALGTTEYVGTQAIGVSLGTSTLFFGGFNATATGGDSKKVRKYDTVTNSWSIVGELPIGINLGLPSAARLGDWIVIAFGREDGKAQGTFIKYHIPTNVATRMSNLVHNGRPADYGMVVSDNKNIYMLTTSTYVTSVQYEKIFRRFDPVTNVFTDLAPPPFTTGKMPCEFAANGKLLVAGIIDNGVDYTTWMAYTPSSNTWDSWKVPEPVEPYIGKKYAVADNKLWVIGVATAAQRACFYIPLD